MSIGKNCCCCGETKGLVTIVGDTVGSAIETAGTGAGNLVAFDVLSFIALHVTTGILFPIKMQFQRRRLTFLLIVIAQILF